MCGIAGATGDWAHREQVQAQLNLLQHRGPDASGVFAASGGVIGQTRLAVIDLVTGDPPVSDESGLRGAVLNGEIYNYRSLRRELLEAGHRLASHGDTEVLAHLAENLEPVELAGRLDGMFAFAVWDAERARLVLGRDRLGKKPLYYHSDGVHLAFASELKALLAHPGVPRRMNETALPDYLTFGYVATPDTFYADIKSLPPGHVLVHEPGRPPELKRYWRLETAGRRAGPTRMRAAAPRVRAELRAAIHRRLIADVPLGAFLSGGVDSSSVVALMSELVDRPVATFTIGFDDQEGYDERPYARLVAQRFGTEHTEFVVQPHASDLVERLVWHHDQPFGDSSALPTYLLAELTRRHVTVALCGDGGDELFAGYERFAAAQLLAGLHRLPRPVVDAATRAIAALPANALAGRALSAQRLLARRALPLPQAYLDWISFVPRDWRTRLLPPGPEEVAGEFAARWDATAGSGELDRLLRLNLDTYLLDDLLPKVDRMAMAHGLEVRSPFLDTEFVEFAFSLPAKLKMRGPALKRVLKAAMADALPGEVLHRRKRGFGLPLDRWFRTDLRPFVQARLGDPRARVRTHLDGPTIDALLAEHLSGVNHGHSLWTLLTLEVFLRQAGW